MPGAKRLRYLLRGATARNDGVRGKFLQQLQRLTHVGAKAGHALMTMLMRPLPGLHTENPVLAPCPDLGSAPGGAGTLSSPTEVFYTPVMTFLTGPRQQFSGIAGNVACPDSCCGSIALANHRPFPPRGSRNQGGQIVCFRSNQAGHIMRQCPGSPSTPSSCPGLAGKPVGPCPGARSAGQGGFVYATFNQTQLIVLPAMVEEQDAQVIIDAGAVVNVISKTMAARLGRTIRPSGFLIRAVNV
ncbi:hypothetical protein IscW_ISCW013456 [Ixodes scapularis]|uniref:Uncharacterized protein n=1 Tax=Ixodes scapularis TaxID=6945 RepID=B7QEZ7_IXOSC|nr:hypothetical protein IscW_ISCW013456 [Ixodes scapularis]|eukprot:XP_002414111.1 hypothetical protein IscW_ISCW013456 [Ixodes scapularis]